MSLTLLSDFFWIFLILWDYFIQPSYEGRCLVLGRLDMPWLADSHERPAFFSERKQRNGLGVRGRRGGWNEGREVVVGM